MSTAESTIRPRTKDALGRLRSPACEPGAGKGETPKTTGRTYPPDAFTNADFLRLLEHCIPDHPNVGTHGRLGGERLKAACVIMFRAGLRVQETLDLNISDLTREDRTITVRRGKGDKRRIVGMDEWGWRYVDRWLTIRAAAGLPPGLLLPCILRGHQGRPWQQDALRHSMARAGERAGLTRRVHPHALRHGFAVGAWRDDLDLLTINRSLGHSHIGTTQMYLVSLGADDLIVPVTERKAPMVAIQAA